MLSQFLLVLAIIYEAYIRNAFFAGLYLPTNAW